MAGYRRALQDVGIPIDPELVQVGAFSRAHGEAGSESLLRLHDRPTVTVVGSNRLLLGALQTFRRHRLQIQEEMSLVAFNDSEWLSIWNPPITVIDTAADQMAKLAVELVMRGISSPELENKPTTYRLSTNLIKRESCMNLNQ